MNSSAIKLVAFDVAGTTVNDDGLVVAAFKVAFEKSQPELWPEKADGPRRFADERPEDHPA